MDKKYWFDAAEKMRLNYPECTFCCFYDKKVSYIDKFIKKYNAVELHGSLVDDMAYIGECDLHIVCNSTFSIMSAYLDTQNGYTIRPQHYYSGTTMLPDDVFFEEWDVMPNRRNLGFFIYRYVRKVVRHQ